MVCYSVVLAILCILAVVVSFVLDQKLSRDIALLHGHGTAMSQGVEISDDEKMSIPNLIQGVQTLRWITWCLFAPLYLSSIHVVWRGWRTIRRQRIEREPVEEQLL